MNNSTITNKILYWYDNNKRILPWRIKTPKNKKEYYVLVSEFMLQQTQVKTVIPYFLKFVTKIPNLKTLSKCKEKNKYLQKNVKKNNHLNLEMVLKKLILMRSQEMLIIMV